MRVGRLRRGGVRTNLFVAAMLGVGVAMAVLVTIFNAVLARTLDRDATDRARSRATSEVAALRPSGATILLGEAPDAGLVDSPIWVFSRGRRLEAPRIDPAVTAAAARLRSGALDIPGAQIRLYAVPVVARGRRLGTVVAGVSLTPYADTRTTALIGSLALAGVLYVLIGVGTWWLLGRSFRPVAEMTAAAETWSEHDLDSRFARGEPFDELSQLAATLDRLLDRIAAALRREQRLTAEISHELRTPLARIQGEAELALRHERDAPTYRETLRTVHHNAKVLAQTIDTLLAAARGASGLPAGTADAAAAAAHAVSACAPLADARHVDVSVQHVGNGARVGVEHDVVVRILQPVIENACRYGQHRVTVKVDASRRDVTYTVIDDGPGVTSVEQTAIFEAGTRGSAGTASSTGAGLGLALSRRLALAVSGDISAQPGPCGWFVIRLPAA